MRSRSAYTTLGSNCSDDISSDETSLDIVERVTASCPPNRLRRHPRALPPKPMPDAPARAPRPILWMAGVTYTGRTLDAIGTGCGGSARESGRGSGRAAAAPRRAVVVVVVVGARCVPGFAGCATAG